MKLMIELVYFEGCPHVARARENLAEALGSVGAANEWKEWDLMDAETPDWAKQFGSPTILVDGKDVTGEGPGASAMACRADGAPDVPVIAVALEKRQGLRASHAPAEGH